jgi:hypothetical protein
MADRQSKDDKNKDSRRPKYAEFTYYTLNTATRKSGINTFTGVLEALGDLFVTDATLMLR